MKVAQFLSTVPDALPAEYAAELAHLQSNAPPMGWAFVRRRMQRSLGRTGSPGSPASATKRRRRRRWARCIAPPCRTGTEVACKLQYPDMPSTVEADLRQLRLAMAVYHRMDNAIQHEEIYKELVPAAARGTRLRARGGADAAVRHHAGRTIRACMCRCRLTELSTKRLLTMTWLDGRPLMTAAGGGPAAGGAQPHRGGAVPRLVRAVLPLRRDPWRPASGQLPGAGGRDGEPAGFRGDPGVSSRISRKRGDRPVRGDARQGHGRRRTGVSQPGGSSICRARRWTC